MQEIVGQAFFRIGGSGILDGGRTQSPRRRESCLGRARNKYSRYECFWQGRRQSQHRHAVEVAFIGQRGGARQEAADDRGVFDQASVSLIVRRGVAQGVQVVLEASGDHVEIETAAVEVGERSDLLGDRVRMHVDRLDRHERAQRRRVLDDDVGKQPGIQETVVRIDKDPLASRLFTPARHLSDPLDVAIFGHAGRGGTGRKQINR